MDDYIIPQAGFEPGSEQDCCLKIAHEKDEVIHFYVLFAPVGFSLHLFISDLCLNCSHDS